MNNPNLTQKLQGYEFYRKVLGSPKYVVAPMVDQSELAYRLLCRKYGAHLAYTPMLHSKNFVERKKYRKVHFSTCSEDRPLITQFCANDPLALLQAASLIETDCDAVDINFGCPQRIARQGNYGAFLMDGDWQLIYNMVSVLHYHLAVPVTCKVRILPSLERSIEFCKMLEKAGCQLLVVHGRTKEQKGLNTGLANWNAIKAIKDSVSIPVIANGNIQKFEDIEACLRATGCEGVMSAEAILMNPALFSGQLPPSHQLAREFLDICGKVDNPAKFIKGHMQKWFRFEDEKVTNELKTALVNARSLEELHVIVDQMKLLEEGSAIPLQERLQQFQHRQKQTKDQAEALFSWEELESNQDDGSAGN